jgi:uncharacterized protein
METFLIVFCVMATLMAMMAIGVVFNNKPISGSCGGMSALGMDVACDICKGDPAKCDKENEAVNEKAASLSYDASEKY